MQKWKIVRFRRSLHLVSYWSVRRLIFQNYATGVRVAANPITCEVLDFFDDWRPLGALYRFMNRFSRFSLRKAVANLARYSLLERSDRIQRPKERAMKAWKEWNPAAGFFHFSTKDIQYATDPLEESQFLRRRAKNWPIPVPVKRYPEACKFPLPRPALDGELPEVLLARRTWRRFSENPIELCSLGTLMGLTWRIQRWIKIPRLGRLALKTSPSGGALHPIEAYVMALRVTGLPSGLYHYAADTHCLELLSRRASHTLAVKFLAGQWWFGPAAALILMTAVFARTQWKYRSPRAYRAVLLEAGHFCQTFCLVATWLKLAPFCTLALNDSLAERHLGLDGVTESVIYAAGVGARPLGLEWSPEPPAF